VIADEVGLQPSGTLAYDPVNVGAIRSAVHLTVLVTVAVLPQASVAVNVLVCEAEHDVVVIVPSVGCYSWSSATISGSSCTKSRSDIRSRRIATH
jgi:hypothetical protein